MNRRPTLPDLRRFAVARSLFPPTTLGDTTVTFVAIPGHTPGSLAFIFPVKDGRQRHVAGLFGGTILTADRITTPGLQQYVQSIDHYLDVAKKMKVDVEVQNHALFDMTPERIAALKARTARAPHNRSVFTVWLPYPGMGVSYGVASTSRVSTQTWVTRPAESWMASARP